SGPAAARHPGMTTNGIRLKSASMRLSPADNKNVKLGGTPMRDWHGDECTRIGCATPTRRALLGAMTALGAGVVLPGIARAEAADVLDPAPRRIDVHHHF